MSREYSPRGFAPAFALSFHFPLTCPLPRFSKRATEFPRKHFVRCQWRVKKVRIQLQAKRGCPLEWTLLSPLGCLLYETNSSEKNCVLWASMFPNQVDTPLLSALELTSLYSRVLSHDVRSSTILLWNDCHIVLADISLCLPTRGSASWLREPGSTITLFGYLEQTQVTLYTCSWILSVGTYDVEVGSACQAGRNALARCPASAAAP